MFRHGGENLDLIAVPMGVTFSGVRARFDALWKGFLLVTLSDMLAKGA